MSPKIPIIVGLVCASGIHTHKLIPYAVKSTERGGLRSTVYCAEVC
jgi:hypothetical protein